MARFGAAHLPSPASPITAAERALLFTPMTQQTENMPPLGLGWRVDSDEKGRLRWHHAGSDEGTRTGLVVYPALGLSIALASNLFAVPGNILKPSSDLADAFA
jgi:serine beta-lactamase-like protein LACTB, mitochondrial